MRAIVAFFVAAKRRVSGRRRYLVTALVGLVALLAGGLELSPGAASAAPTKTAASSPAPSNLGSVSGPSPVDTAVSVPALWTASSRTTLEPNGTYQAQFWPAPVNYKNASTGTFSAIDNALVSDANGVAHNTANSWQVSLPSSLASPVKVTDGSNWVSYALAGASSTAASSLSGATATYAQALPGVSVAYTADSDRLSETLTLANAEAPSSYQFTVAASAGMTVAQAADGGLSVQAAGTQVFELAPPTLADSSHTAAGQSTDASLTAVPSNGGWTATLAVHPAWLASSARVWPVVVDPTVYFGTSDTQGCNPVSDMPTTNRCSMSTYYLGHGTGGGAGRGFFQFNDVTTTIPRVEMSTRFGPSVMA